MDKYQQQHQYHYQHQNNYKLKSKSDVVFCNNCGKYGHLFNICKIPITSIGVICFRVHEGNMQFLMIRRKDTLGYTDFIRGKFSTKQKFYILNMIKQMTNTEKQYLLQKYYLIKNNQEVCPSLKEKIVHLIHGIEYDGEKYDLKSLIIESNQDNCWEEPEWGFPKGRRNTQESDYDCAIREFSEETGYTSKLLHNVRNIVPFEEVFTGSNYNSYRHKYYIMYIPYESSIKSNNFQKSEVSKMEWKTLEECLESIRPYNLEKKQIIQNVHQCLQTTTLYSLRTK